ncbi:MAG: hypothetical protein FJ276_07400 [Planctomycetes bacterium]|nr:hypothetical protein [Planctomycetota bacterium]
MKAAAQAAGQKADCAGKVCLHHLLAEVQDNSTPPTCVYRVYVAHRCLSGGGYEEVSLERDCNYTGNLPEASCSNTNECTKCGTPIPVPVLLGDRNAQPAGRKHQADKELATKGTELLGATCKPREETGGEVVEEDIIRLPGARATDTEKPRLAKLIWIALPNGDFVGIGFEVLEGEPTIPNSDVKHKHLVEEGDKKNSYSVTAKSKKGEWRHYAVYMLR